MKIFLKTMTLILLLAGCTKELPVTPVQGFQLNRYLGTWYEIARLDHFFERGLEQVTAHYSLRADGGVRVVNRGYSVENSQWKEAVGKAFPVSSKTDGLLKVSFFGPFYSPYVIFFLDPDYRYAYVAGPDHEYLWLLSRTPSVPQKVFEHFVDVAQKEGFDVCQLIRVRQE